MKRTLSLVFVGLVLIIGNCYSQNKTIDSLRNAITELELSTKQLPIKVSWNYLPYNEAVSYDVYYCSADDTSKIPLKDGIDANLVWDWKLGNTIYNYLWVKQPLKRFLRIGIVGIGGNGQSTLMKCYTYDTL